MRILIVSFIFPFPVDSGGACDIFTRLVALRDAGYSVDLIATVRKRPAEADLRLVRSLVNSVQIIERRRELWDLFSLRPFHDRSRAELKTIPITGDFLFVLLESELVGGVLENPTLQAPYRILRVHNDEAVLHRSLARAAERIVDRVLFFAESLKFKWYSPTLWRQCDMLWFISSSELDCTGKTARGQGLLPRLHLVRSIYNAGDLKRRPLSGSTVLYVGALSVPVNAKGLIWYLKHIHPHMLEDPEYQFVIAGRRGTANIDGLLRTVRSNARVQLHTDILDLDSFYEEAAAFVNPIQQGAGVKIKTLDAAAQGLPVVTTAAGAEGTGFEDGLQAVVAVSKQTFLLGLKRCISDKAFAQRMVEQAQQVIQRQNGPGDLLDALHVLQEQVCMYSSP